MSQSGMIFDYSNSVLKAGEVDAVPREDESEVGDFHEMLSGGGVAVRHLARGTKAVPATIEVGDLEVVKYLAATSLAGEFEDGAWWVRSDEFSVPSNPLHAKCSALKRSWARVDKDALPMPLFAPRFPGTAGSTEDYTALVQRVVDLHNAGKVPGLVAHGARDKWLRAPVAVYPSLLLIREANADALKCDNEVKFLISDLNLESLAESNAAAAATSAGAMEPPVEVVEEMEMEVVEEEELAGEAAKETMTVCYCRATAAAPVREGGPVLCT